MSRQTWQETLITAEVDGPANASTSGTDVSLLPPAAKLTLPSNFFSIGKTLRILASGRISVAVAGPTLNLKVAFISGSTIFVFAGGANPLVARSITNATWDLEITMTCRAIGNGTVANLMGTGKFISEAALGSAANVAVASMLPLSAPAVGAGFDSTLTNQVDLTSNWGTSSALNSIQLHTYLLKSLN